MSDDPGPTRLGRYRLVRKLGRGGMATVFAAVQEGPHGFENEVAIKLVHPHLLREHPHVVRMVVDEARVASRIRHPNVVRIMDLCEEPPDVLYIVMDYVDGVSMRQVLDTARTMRNRPPPAPVLEVLAAACDGLHAAHQATQPDGTPLNLVHRDVKPGNILVSSDGEVKVGDFGIAFFGDRLVESTAHGQMKGTPAYMSPEQVLGTPVDARSDIFSMGLTLYTLMTSKLAFGGESPMGMAMKIAHESLEPHAAELDELCLGLGDILRTACAKEPMARYPQAAAMGAELRELRDTLRGKATIAEMVVAAGWKPRAPDERPGEMASIDAKGTVVDVGPIGRAAPAPEPIIEPAPGGGPVEVTLAEDRPALEETEDTDPRAPRPVESDEPTTNEAPAPVEPELLPPDPYARPVMAGRAPRVEVTGSRPRVFDAAPPGPPPPGGAPPRPPGPPPRRPPGPPPSGPVRRPPGARPPGPPPGSAGGRRRPPQVLERDYRGRVIRKKPEEEESTGIGLVEKLGVAVAFVMVLTAVAVIVNREPTPNPFGEDPAPEEETVAAVAEPTQPPREEEFAAAADSTRLAEQLPPEPEPAPESATPEPAPVPVEPAPVVGATPAATPAPVAVAPKPTPTPTPEVESSRASGTGLLTVNSYPWAEVHLDGRRIGNTPVIERTIDAGPHTVRLVFTVPGPDGAVPEAIEKSIEVEGGEHEKVVHRAK